MEGPALRDSTVNCSSVRFHPGDNRPIEILFSAKKNVVAIYLLHPMRQIHMLVSTGLGEQGTSGFIRTFLSEMENNGMQRLDRRRDDRPRERG